MSVFTNEVNIGNEVLVDGSAHVQPVSGPLTDAQLRASVVPVTVANFPATQPVSGPLTDTQLRAVAVPVSVSGSVSVSNFPATQPVSGTVAVSNFPATQPVSGPLTDAQLRAVPVPISGTVSTTPSVSSSATITRVATAATSTLLLAANASRKRAIIMTETGTANYVALGATATITSYTYVLGSTTVLEISGYTGPISMIRASGNGNVQVTELV